MMDARDCIAVLRRENGSRTVCAMVRLLDVHIEEAVKALKSANAETFRKYQGQISMLELLKKEIVGDAVSAQSKSGAYGG